MINIFRISRTAVCMAVLIAISTLAAADTGKFYYLVWDLRNTEPGKSKEVREVVKQQNVAKGDIIEVEVAFAAIMCDFEKSMTTYILANISAPATTCVYIGSVRDSN